jgi:glycine betaine catabolism B
VGDTLAITGPAGRFLFPDDSRHPIVLIAGGIGITPFRSMRKFATDCKLPHCITLLYFSRSSKVILFREEFQEFERINSNLKVVHTLTRESVESRRTGHIDGKFIEGQVPDLRSSLIYVCGTPSFTTAIKNILSGNGISEARIFVEKFPGYASSSSLTMIRPSTISVESLHQLFQEFRTMVDA